ncbi:sensor histidine kinase [Lysinibacillus sp. 54212]|uniref:sensor histidine kinase n=1 Tax=Lysinibacillus sp. 54212 TaxID=3119829 RepID=UPI002FC7D965
MKTLYRQFLIAMLFILSFSLVAGFVIANYFYLTSTKEINDENNVKVALEMKSALEQMHGVGLENYLTSIGNIGYQAYVINEDGYEKYFGGEFRDTELPEDAREKVLAGDTYHGMKEYSDKTFMTGFFANELNNTVGVPFTYNDVQYGLFLRPNIKLMFSDVHSILASLLLSTIIISVIAVLWMAKQLIRPIAQLTEATQQITNDNYNVSLEINRRDEIGQLAESFNSMVVQLQENDRARKEFISNVSHDFQSPLLNIQGYADLLKMKELTEEERFEYSSIIDKEAKRLSTLTKQLLLLTSLDQSTRMIRKAPFALDVQLVTMIQKYRWRLEELQLDISYSIQPVLYNGDESLLENVWENLLTNAMKYNQKNGTIFVELASSESTVLVVVRDSGIGMELAELERIFDRFYRVDESRTKDGTGLGLAIVKDILALHDGTITASSEVGIGTEFIITLPK